MEFVFKENLLVERVALVTGASRGIGRSIAITLARAGAFVLLVSRSSEKLKEVREEIESFKGKCETVSADVSEFERVKSVFEFVEEKLGRLDILVNCAGVSPHYTSFHKSNIEDWHHIIKINLLGTLYCCKCAFPLLCESNSASVVNVSSIGGIVGLPRVAVYSASKGAIVTFTRTLSLEWARFNIRVNAVCPGFVETDMTKGILSREDLKEQLISKIPLRRVAKPEEIASVVLFLVSPAASYITGQCLTVDGGWTAE